MRRIVTAYRNSRAYPALTLATCGAVWGLVALNPPGMPWVLAVVLVPYWAACWLAARYYSRPARLRHPPPPQGRAGRVIPPRTLGGHIHSGPGPCPECVITLGMLAGLVGAVIDVAATPPPRCPVCNGTGHGGTSAAHGPANCPGNGADERLASTGEISGAALLAQALAWSAAIEDEALSYMAGFEARAAGLRVSLGAPLSSVPPCGQRLDRHLCQERTPRGHTHKCSCGTVWGIISDS